MRVKYDTENYCTRCEIKTSKNITCCLVCHYKMRTVSHQPIEKFKNGNKNEGRMKRY